jgi:hypothetical protein
MLGAPAESGAPEFRRRDRDPFGFVGRRLLLQGKFRNPAANVVADEKIIADFGRVCSQPVSVVNRRRQDRGTSGLHVNPRLRNAETRTART